MTLPDLLACRLAGSLAPLDNGGGGAAFGTFCARYRLAPDSLEGRAWLEGWEQSRKADEESRRPVPISMWFRKPDPERNDC
jgi:hypothetical protein